MPARSSNGPLVLLDSSCSSHGHVQQYGARLIRTYADFRIQAYHSFCGCITCVSYDDIPVYQVCVPLLVCLSFTFPGYSSIPERLESEACRGFHGLGYASECENNSLTGATTRRACRARSS